MNQLNVGDKIIGKPHYGGMSRLTITRVTAKRAFAKVKRLHGTSEYGFYREYKTNCWIDAYPAETGYTTTRFLIATDKLLKEFKVEKNLSIIKDVKWEDRKPEEIQKVLSLLNIKNAGSKGKPT